MLLENFLALPAGTAVYGDIESVGLLAGVMERDMDGTQRIRWEDGFVTVALGRDRDLDEYFAGRTYLATPCIALPARQQDQAEERKEHIAEVCHA
jgi:hypothetical protein